MRTCVCYLDFLVDIFVPVAGLWGCFGYSDTVSSGEPYLFENISLDLKSEFLRNWKSGASAALATDEQTML